MKTLSLIILLVSFTHISNAQIASDNLGWISTSSVTSATSPSFNTCSGPVSYTITSPLGFRNISAAGDPNYTTGMVTPAAIFDPSLSIPITITFSQPVCNVRIQFTDLDGGQNEYLNAISPAYDGLTDVVGHLSNPGNSTQVNSNMDNSSGWVEWNGSITSISFNYNRPGPGCGLIIDSMIFECCSTSPCSQYPPLNLGNDTMLCPGASITYTVPAGYDYYNWNIAPGNQSSVTITSPTTLILNVANYTQNLVVNGDFESGNTDFTTGYGPGTGGSFGLLTNPGTYAITTSPNLVHNNFGACSDLGTTGPGNMLVVNGSNVPNTTVWSQTIAVDPSTDYSFSAWVTSVENITQSNVAVLQFFIDGVQIGPVFSPTLLSCNWQQFIQPWNSGSSTSATISIVAQVSSGNNDFAIDNITFNTVCPQSDTIVITYDPSQISAGPNVTFCENEPETITATANYPNPNFTWETGVTTPTITPATSGWYTVSAVSPSGSGCILRDSVNVSITAMPWGFDTVAAQPTDCGVNDGAVYTLLHGPFVGQPIYTWNGPGANNPNEINASVWQNLGAGWYYIDVENQGCHRTDSVLVTTLNPPTAQVSANPTSGYGPLSVTFTNGSSNSNDFDWYFGNGNTNSTTDLSSQNQVYDSVGSYNVILVAINGNCTDTAFVTVVVLPPPVPPIPPVIVPVDIKAPNIFTPNGDHVNDFFTFELLNIKELNVTVVNRWGNPVYISSAVPFSWDGKDSGGNLVNEGVYFYKYTAKGAQDELFEGQGFVQLFK
nr:gliding motility-associated C-terminal domain-containing protein [uncultured Fluviicola sp.]